MTEDQEYFLWVLFKRLREWHFPLAPQDYQSLHDALTLGFGWGSRAELRSVCSALWAKSRQEQEILFALFDALVEDFGWEDWQLPESAALTDKPPAPKPPDAVPAPKAGSSPPSQEGAVPYPITPEPELHPPGETAGISVTALLKELDAFPSAQLILSPRYVLSYRQVAQAWRRLRRWVRRGPKTELDPEATLDLRCRKGVVLPVVLRSPQRNAVRLLLLLDRQGSMAPFHRFTDQAICAAIDPSGRLEQAATYYFHDVPSGQRSPENTELLGDLTQRLFPGIDPVIGAIQPSRSSALYRDPRLLQAQPLRDVLNAQGVGVAVVIVSDAGAARGHYDTGRLVDTVAFLKTLHEYTPHVVWLNPLPKERWQDTSAAQIARYVPMFPVDREGLHRAVNVLQGQVFELEHPL